MSKDVDSYLLCSRSEKEEEEEEINERAIKYLTRTPKTSNEEATYYLVLILLNEAVDALTITTEFPT
jgi:hypothetical protein